MTTHSTSPGRHRRPGLARRAAVLAAALAALATTAMTTAPAGAQVARRTQPATRPHISLQPPPVPTTGAYLGAWVDPNHLLETEPNATIAEVSQLALFQASIGRPLAIVHAYQSWTEHVQNQTLAALASTGAIPMIDWACGAPDTAIIDGTYDQMIETFALQLVDYGRPVFLRWYWEPNFPSSKNYHLCINTGGPISYAHAFQHIWRIFHAVGATNVAFVWNPSVVHQTGLNAYYPGNQYVDWIGMDGYDRTGGGIPVFNNVFGTFYKQWVVKEKPMMVGETGAQAGGKNPDQPQYLEGLASAVPNSYPQIKAIVYFDGTNDQADWSIQGGGGTTGLSAFTALGEEKYFSVMP